MTLPAQSMPMFWLAHTMVEPMTQRTQPIMMAFLRPNRSLMKPERRAPSHEPAGMAAEMPPCTAEVGPLHLSALLKGGPSGPKTS